MTSSENYILSGIRSSPTQPAVGPPWVVDWYLITLPLPFSVLVVLSIVSDLECPICACVVSSMGYTSDVLDPGRSSQVNGGN